MGNYAENLSELQRLLGEDFISAKVTAQHPLRKALERVLDYHRENDYLNRDYENGMISLLVKNLKEIEQHDTKLSRVLKRHLKKSDADTYFGIRLEVSVAASLIRHNIPFRKTEHPDFTLCSQFEGATIECGSAHLSESKPGLKDLKYKIGSAINEKVKKDYCNHGLALFIDFTNINYYSKINESLIGNDELKNFIRSILNSANIGSILMWTFMINKDLNQYQWKYHSVDNNNPNGQLLEFLNSNYPFGVDITHSYDFPIRG